MRALVIHPGADSSTVDVHDGLVGALHRAGHETVSYGLSGRIQQAGSWLDHAYRRMRKREPDIEQPTIADVIYHACQGALERVVRFQPDVVLVISSMFFPPDSLILLRRMGCKVGIVLTESPYDDEQQMKVAALANIVWTNERTSVETLRAANRQTHYLPHAFDAGRHLRSPLYQEDGTPAELPAHDVVFVGTGFAERCELLGAIDWDGIDLALYGNWQLLGSRNRLRRYVRGGVVPNQITAELYRRAKVGLNLHRTSMGFGRYAPRIGHAASLNPRAYELAATGCFHLSDEREEVREVFGDLVPTFRTPAELGAMVRQYLADDTARAEVAARLPAAVAGHTFDARVEQIVSDLQRAWS